MKTAAFIAHALCRGNPIGKSLAYIIRPPFAHAANGFASVRDPESNLRLAMMSSWCRDTMPENRLEGATRHTRLSEALAVCFCCLRKSALAAWRGQIVRWKCSLG